MPPWNRSNSRTVGTFTTTGHTFIKLPLLSKPPPEQAQPISINRATGGVRISKGIIEGIRITVPALRVPLMGTSASGIRTGEPALRCGEVPGSEVIETGFRIALFAG